MIALKIEDITLNQQFATKLAAIEACGQLLAKQGYTSAEYTKKMIERDELTTTYIGNMVAIPHGTDDSKAWIHQSGIVILQVPDGVDFDGNQVKLIIGIAGIENEHLELLSEIALVCSDVENVAEIVAASSAEKIIQLFKDGVNV